jgi:Lrp/AsnC family transcriptional regulator, regulator for asnA, asnC and gidA
MDWVSRRSAKSDGRPAMNGPARGRGRSTAGQVSLLPGTGPQPPIALDALDEQIITALRRDGRQANTQLGRQLGVSETTIRKRIQKLRDAGIIEVRAFVDLRHLGLDWDIIILVNCAPGRIKEVAQRIGALSEVRYVAIMTGRYDLMVAAFFRSQAELLAFLLDRLSTIEGITRTESLHRLQATKYDSMRFL